MGFSVTIASAIVLIGMIVLFGSVSAVLVYSLNVLSDTAREYLRHERDKIDVKLELEIETISQDSCTIIVKNLGTKTIFLKEQEDFQWNSIVISYQNAARTSAPWLSGWDRRAKITIDSNEVDSALSNFPVLVHLSNSSGRNNDSVSFVFDELQSDVNRKKIAVTTSDGVTQCYVEIEKWDDANEQAWLWVKVPSVSGSSDTALYLYYDNEHADNTDYIGDTGSTPAANVWDSNYLLVWHLSEEGDAVDSTSNSNNGTVTGLTRVAGKIGSAKNSSGGSNGIVSASAITLSTGQFTVEGWFYPNVYTTEWIGLFGPKHPTDDYNEIMWPYQGKWGYWDNSPVAVTSNQPLIADQWDYYVVVREGTGTNELKNYIGGSYDNAGTTAYDFPAQPVWLGKYSTSPWNGISDELRISNTARNASWIKASYESARDDLVDFGSEESENPQLFSCTIEDYTVLDVNVIDTQISFNPASHRFINPGEEARIRFNLAEDAPAIPTGAPVIIVFASHYGVAAQAEGAR